MKAGVYRHYKGNLYCVLGVARHDATNEELVVYVPLFEHPDGGPALQCRNREEFCGVVADPSEAIGCQPRFQYLGIDRPKGIK